jgi:N-acetylglucosaminyldiphosphoundecaprenol N-acetyl-beta-D-mannosaminyltransferase
MKASETRHCAEPQRVRFVLGTKLECTNYQFFTDYSATLASLNKVSAVDFTNTQIVTMRRHDAGFREITSRFDFFVPDATPLIWCLRLQGESRATRTYGPRFMRYCMANCPTTITHYLLGGSKDCLEKLQQALQRSNPSVRIIGARDGYFDPADEQSIINEINDLSPDFVWVGLGTPKQQDWIHRNKPKLNRGVLFAVGFAFDVNAGTKPDAPEWMHKFGLTWFYRMCSEPKRLIPRYLKYNSLFLGYLISDLISGNAWKSRFPVVPLK